MKGIGIDVVDVVEARRLFGRLDEAVLARMFSAGELAEAHVAPSLGARLALRFAAKEAVFKAVAHLVTDQKFDARMVETVGTPAANIRVKMTAELRAVLDQAGVEDVLITATAAENFVVTMAIAQ